MATHDFLGYAMVILAQKLSKLCNFSKLALSLSKSGKRRKQMCISPFWGDVGSKMWSPFLVSTLENGHFWRRCPFSSAKKWHNTINTVHTINTVNTVNTVNRVNTVNTYPAFSYIQLHYPQPHYRNHLGLNL